MEKTCTKCKTQKQIDDFPKNKKGKYGYGSCCLECQRKRVHEHYVANKQYYVSKARVREQEIREWYQQFKVGLQCKCGESHPACIDFHHEDSKEVAINEAVRRSWTKEKILKEISKCTVMCSNCHRKLHWETKTGPYQWRD